MKTPQAGIFAIGTASHAYLEFDIVNPRDGEEFVARISALREPRTTIGGVNLVVGFRPELWNKVAPDHAPAALHGFNTEIVRKRRVRHARYTARRRLVALGKRVRRTLRCRPHGHRRREKAGLSSRRDLQLSVPA